MPPIREERFGRAIVTVHGDATPGLRPSQHAAYETSLGSIKGENFGASGFLEADRDGVALGEGLDASAATRVGRLAQNLPSLSQHPGDVGVHPLEAEHPLSMDGRFPTSFFHK